MAGALSQIGQRFKAAALAFRSYEAAGAGRRWRGAPEIPHQGAAMTAARGPIGRRARALVANNALASSGVEAWVSNIAGAGIKPQSSHPDETVRSAINAAWDRWTDRADADGLVDFYGMQTMVVRRMVVDGDVFAAPTLDGAEGNPLRVRLFDAEQVDPLRFQVFPNSTGRVVAGVEFDARGRRVAYHVYKERPEFNFWGSLATVRLPADRLLQIFRPEAPGQVRGLSWLAPILLSLSDFDQLADAQLMRQKVAALLTGFIINQGGDSSPFAGDPSADGSAIDSGLEPGTLKVLSAGQDVKFSDPATIGAESVDFLRLTVRHIAAGLSVPYEVLTGDLSQVNFSSIRAGLLEFRRRVEAIQNNVIIFQFCRPIWERWLTAAALSGEVDARGFARDPRAFMAAKWITPRKEFVDPLKDARAEIESINAGVMSRREAVAARGWDIEQLDAEIAADHERAKRLGLQFGVPHSPIDPTQEESQ
ncbi:phage portal protein [Bradyrhizobium elkanii]|uniref:Phage portal protein n=1 Tax=Bradyrhizobium elkanii TaxID=29448 RepID=A0A4U6RHC0_BRAEL|nr:phage portal protein [Bradyrhizobium elkanii]TKV73300.1 phage portal protein [Bradyrhizobium elkanii]